MSTFSLTRGSEAALGMLASQAGTETLLLTHPARDLRAELSIEPFTSDSGDQLLAVLFMREQRHSMTLQRNDGANFQHLADWIEAVANGTLDTAEAIPQRAYPSDLAGATAAFNAATHELNAQTGPAPAQDEPLYVTHRPLIRNAIGLLGMRRPVSPGVQQVIDDLEMMLKGMPTPSVPAEAQWLDVAEEATRLVQTEQQPEQRKWVEMIDAAMLEMRNIAPPLRRSECARLIRAALAAGLTA